VKHLDPPAEELVVPAPAAPPPLPPRHVLLWHTLRHLRPIQWRYRLTGMVRRLQRGLFPTLLRQALLRRVPESPTLRFPPIRVDWFRKTHDGEHGMFVPRDVLALKFRFLHREKCFANGIAWQNSEFTYLWDFNLHYFEFLPALAEIATEATEAERETLMAGMAAMVDSWIAANPLPVQPAWHPYPTSLRIIHWIKTLHQCPRLSSPAILRSLYAQALYLERNVEGHLMVNHFLENGRALVFAGLFYEGKDARRWLAKGLGMLHQELAEQWLPQGGHFERSPMYHAILVEGLLDMYMLLAAHGQAVDWLRAPLVRMCDWLAAVRTPDGWFPLFNDAAIGISASPDEILTNAGRMIGYRLPERAAAVRDCDQLWLLESGDFVCAIDGAPIGPDYNPGHAHADNLSFEAWYRGEKLVVDPGVYTYDGGHARNWLRSSLSHNTVVVNGVEQSETWGGFRVARRSHARSRAKHLGELLAFQGRYENRVATSAQIRHERFLVLLPERVILVWDLLSAAGDIRAESTCQFAPSWSVSARDGGGFRLTREGGSELYCTPLQGEAATILRGIYSPEFGLAGPVGRLRFIAEGRHALEMGYAISTAPIEQIGPLRVERTAGVFAITVGARRHELDTKELAS